MSIEVVEGKYIRLTYNTETFRTVESVLQLGDCLFARFDEAATYFTYKFVQTWAAAGREAPPAFVLEKGGGEQPALMQRVGLKAKVPAEKLEIPHYCLDLAPAYVFMPHERIKVLYEDFSEILERVKGSVVWPQEGQVQ